jgi:hypothetical protein
VDKDDADERPLPLALVSARCAVRRQRHASGALDDVEPAIALVDDGQRVLTFHSAVKRCHTAA